MDRTSGSEPGDRGLNPCLGTTTPRSSPGEHRYDTPEAGGAAPPVETRYRCGVMATHTPLKRGDEGSSPSGGTTYPVEAQLAEHLTFNQGGVGSNPTNGTSCRSLGRQSTALVQRRPRCNSGRRLHPPVA
ncbi:MAG: hypothetical protein GFH27_549431n46 [Chloroflexi bacterium AL-W]|nr:hypothetical protein [Chloroflexi bacterium AL-N1]NOK71650.1 hypothetical protein [Chloroflexi bacterium AL-N10]NOK78950.1 hypothetical protein [Chloroflexi bacterium AL-N5]NOK86425.1 hypothetical protein [Chloroflexi bacterium AL-W]